MEQRWTLKLLSTLSGSKVSIQTHCDKNTDPIQTHFKTKYRPLQTWARYFLLVNLWGFVMGPNFIRKVSKLYWEGCQTLLGRLLKYIGKLAIYWEGGQHLLGRLPNFIEKIAHLYRQMDVLNWQHILSITNIVFYLYCLLIKQ